MDDFDNAEYQSAREALEAIRGKWRKDIRTKDAGTIERRLLHYLDFEDLRQQTQWHRMINSIIREYSELIAAHMANLTIPGSETENQIKSRRDEFYRYPLEYSEEEHRYLNQLFIAFLAKNCENAVARGFRRPALL
ncbi:hypothetical protein [Croceicoccus marinus]|uniref:Uncharacterized protein n=1 Tax=Croceicoccus marinus TaxID=450378 RepID=A0A7G6VZU7_9SPHN|nr:hypothetical protein [Croceicoccus marinus]QNE07262.1 hypothetical protein H4O24_15205 [Croceicoccus marinus]